MKIAPIVRALDRLRERFIYHIVYTGHHYDREMSDIFFEELGTPQPNCHFECGCGSHAEQAAKIMITFEKLCQLKQPYAYSFCTHRSRSC